MLTVTINGQQVQMSPEAQLERTQILGAIAAAVVALLIPVVLSHFCPVEGLDKATNLAVLYAISLGAIFGFTAGIMAVVEVDSREKLFAQVLLLPVVAAGLISAGVVAGVAVLFPFCFTGAGFLLVGAVVGKIFKL